MEIKGELLAIVVLLAAVTFVIARIPKAKEVNHSPAFARRRVLNWLPLGLTYAFLYMGRYNLNISKFAFEEMQGADGGAMMSNEDFGLIFTVGVWVYGTAFVLNGPLTDAFGGRKAILAGAGGAALANLLMGAAAWSLSTHGPGATFLAENFVVVFSLLYGLNMYFQSFGAVAVVKCNTPWFHVRERGVFGAIFGILISLGIYFAYDWGYFIVKGFGVVPVFVVPAVILIALWAIDFVLVRNSPGEAGFEDFDTADATDDGPKLGVAQVFRKMLTNPVIMTIALVEFCSGFIRQAPMQWYRTFAKQTDIALHLKGDIIYEHWGMWLCVAGILGGAVAGIISDRVFQSRRGPVAAMLYLGVTLGAVLLYFTYDTPVWQLAEGWSLAWPGVLAIIISMFVIGVHGMLSGTASMDFGGRQNVGVAVGIIDGFVYLGSGVMSLTYAMVLPQEQYDANKNLVGPVTDPANWSPWPLSMIVVGALGFVLATRVWNAKPTKSGGGH